MRCHSRRLEEFLHICDVCVHMSACVLGEHSGKSSLRRPHHQAQSSHLQQRTTGSEGLNDTLEAIELSRKRAELGTHLLPDPWS